MSKICGVYSIINTVTGKSYIGSSCDIKRRFNHHRQWLDKNIHHCMYLQRSWNKHGKHNFVFNIIQECKKQDLLILEQELLDKAKNNKKNYYNSTFHAGGQQPKTVTKKQKADITRYWIKHNTAKTFVYAKKKYGFGMLLIQHLLVDIRKETTDRPEHPLIKSDIYTFYHQDGRIFTGKSYDFRKKYGISHSSLWALRNGKNQTTLGWSLNPQACKTNT